MKSKKLSEVIIKNFKSNGFVLSEPDVLLDSDYIIERSGEKFRSSMLTFDREDGKTMCLRPDLTVASCISFLQKKTSAKIYYSGQAYRRSGEKFRSFMLTFENEDGKTMCLRPDLTVATCINN